jgi:hypothetical protein
VVNAAVASPATIDADRRYIPITGGTVTGAYTGRVRPGGDWQLSRGNGLVEIAAHYMLDLTGHGLVEVTSEGLRHASPEVTAALIRDEPVDPSAYYFRTAIRLRTGVAALMHLNTRIYVGAGTRYPDHAEIAVFEVT